MKTLLTLFITALLSACNGIDGSRYAVDTPPFDLFEFFTGNVTAWGIVQDRSGNVTQRFSVNIVGSVADNTLTLDETFTYTKGDGPATRVWTINRDSTDQYSGSAGDINGTAIGEAFGNGFNWAYEMDLPVGSNSVTVKFDDWIWALDDNTIVNRSYIKKFGLTFAEVTIFMRKG